MPSGSAGFSSAGDPHPREYIRSHKQEIEAWDAYAWKQLLNTFEALKRAWETRRSELREKVTGLQAQLQYAGYYNQAQIQQEGGKIQGVSQLLLLSSSSLGWLELTRLLFLTSC